MDSTRFDSLTRVLAARLPRRAAVGAGLLGALGFAVPAADAGAKKKPNGKKKPCGKGKKRCGGACVDLGTNARHCGGCGNACGGGSTCCSGRCVNVLSDRANCGACGNACDIDDACANGVCKRCEAPFSVCGGQCVDLKTDRNNCGACDNACPRDPQGKASRDLECVNGNCTCTGSTCPDGRCCPAKFSICVDNGTECCPDGYPLWCRDKGTCCPAGHQCGGTCGQQCCR